MLAVLVPVLGRPHRVEPLVASMGAATPEPHRVVFIASPGDHDTLAAVRASGADLLVASRVERGDYATKINLGYRETAEPHLFLGADDLRFHAGWYRAAVARLDGTVQVVGTNDLGSPRVIAGDHATHSLVTRTYVDEHGTIDEPGKVLHEGYWHEFVDDEFVATAKHRGVWAHAGDAVVEHLHPNWGKAPMDRLYARQAQRMRSGRRVFERRSVLWT